jgi:hypothetical protein
MTISLYLYISISIYLSTYSDIYSTSDLMNHLPSDEHSVRATTCNVVIEGGERLSLVNECNVKPSHFHILFRCSFWVRPSAARAAVLPRTARAVRYRMRRGAPSEYKNGRAKAAAHGRAARGGAAHGSIAICAPSPRHARARRTEAIAMTEASDAEPRVECS